MIPFLLVLCRVITIVSVIRQASCKRDVDTSSFVPVNSVQTCLDASLHTVYRVIVCEDLVLTAGLADEFDIQMFR